MRNVNKPRPSCASSGCRHDCTQSVGPAGKRKAAALAIVAQRETEVDLVSKRAARVMELASKGVVTAQAADDARASVSSANAALSATRAQAAAMDSAITTARSQINGALSAAAAARASVAKIQADIDDSTLKAPRDGRVQYLVAHPGKSSAAAAGS